MEKRSNNPREFLSPEESDLVERAVKQAESGTSAEIKVVITRHCWGSTGDKAARTFKKLGLHKTAQRNCVLILLVTTNREFAIFGDSGIHQHAGQEHWDNVRDHMTRLFGEGAFAQGLCDGVTMIGQKLANYFPRQDNNINEINDDIGYQE